MMVMMMMRIIKIYNSKFTKENKIYFPVFFLIYTKKYLFYYEVRKVFRIQWKTGRILLE